MSRYPSRIVCLTEETTETIYLLGQGDRIVGVAQGAGGVMTDVMGWRLDDTVALIRGTADSVVVLDVPPQQRY